MDATPNIGARAGWVYRRLFGDASGKIAASHLNPLSGGAYSRPVGMNLDCRWQASHRCKTWKLPHAAIRLTCASASMSIMSRPCACAGGAFSRPVRAALLAIEAGADGHHRPFARGPAHIRDEGHGRLRREIFKALNFEMAATDEWWRLRSTRGTARLLPRPEKRSERTTEGGLDVIGDMII